MTKEVFLKTLREKLKVLPEEDIEERISFYEEIINDKMDEGKTEEQAVEEIGPVDDVVYEIVQDTPLTKLVKKKVKPSRKLKGWVIALICIGFPLWFPLALVAFILCLVGYLLIWVLVAVCYAVEASLIVTSVGGMVIFFIQLFTGTFNLMPLAAAILATGGAIFLFFGCIAVTKETLKLSKKIINKIKRSFIKNEGGETK